MAGLPGTGHPSGFYLSLPAHREQDTESGLVHMRARMYDPRVGRLTQVDPLIGNRSAEHYIYASNNSLTHYDRMGLQDEKKQVQVSARFSFWDEKERKEYIGCFNQWWTRAFTAATIPSKYVFNPSNPQVLLDSTDEVGIVSELNKGDIGLLIAHGKGEEVYLPSGKAINIASFRNIEVRKGLKMKMMIACVCKSEAGGEKLADAFAEMGVQVVISGAMKDIEDEKLANFTRRFLAGATNKDKDKRESIDLAFKAAAKEVGFWDPKAEKPSGIVMKTAKGVDTSKYLEFDK